MQIFRTTLAAPKTMLREVEIFDAQARVKFFPAISLVRAARKHVFATQHFGDTNSVPSSKKA
jgi:hypothetical protein